MPAEKAQMLNRAFQLLDCFTPDHPQLGVREAARMIGLSSSTTGRLMAAMKESGVLSQDPESRMYSLGGKVLSWAGVYTASLDVRQKAYFHMEQLFKSTQETISLYVIEGNDRVCVERMESNQSVRMTNRIGRRMPLYAGSAGKAFLAFVPEVRREEIIKSSALIPLTSNTITNPARLREDLLRIRQCGYAVSHGEWAIEASGVAAPIFDVRGDVIAVLTISGPNQRFTDETVARYASEVVQVAREISQEMGYREIQYSEMLQK
jgi:DNA-binding IclR family transcriptional regulator